MRRHHTKEEALRIVGSHLVTLLDCYRKAWTLWRQIQAQHATNGVFLSPTARARMMYEYVTGFAQREFSGVAGVHVKNPLRGFLTLTFGSELVVRFKKLDEGLKIRGIPTQQFIDFSDQNVQELPGLPPTATLVVAGYQLDAVGARIARLVLTCRDGDALLWSHDFTMPATSSVQPMPVRTRQQVPARVRSRIRKAAEQNDA